MTEVLKGDVITADGTVIDRDGNEAPVTLQLVERALWLSRGNKAKAGRRLGITRQAVNNWLNRHPSLRTVASEARMTLVDLAIDNLERALIAREVWATELTLMTLGKGEGFTRRMEMTPTSPLAVTFSDADYAMG